MAAPPILQQCLDMFGRVLAHACHMLDGGHSCILCSHLGLVSGGLLLSEEPWEGHSSVVDPMFSMSKALGSVLNTKNNHQNLPILIGCARFKVEFFFSQSNNLCTW